MKTIFGLDLGTTSIGWAVIIEAENENEQSSIVKLGVRVVPLTTDESKDFSAGKPTTTNADRTQKRGARRNLQRYKLRRRDLIQTMKEHGLITDTSIFCEDGKVTTHETWRLRALAATQIISLEELAKVFLQINKKRGYKSNRKVKDDDEGALVDGMAIAKLLYDQQLTPGQYVYDRLKDGSQYIPSFYRSDLQMEYDRIWKAQAKIHPNFLTPELHKKLKGQGLQNTRKRILAISGIYTAENKGSRDEKRMQAYEWRVQALSHDLRPEVVAYVLTEINNNLKKSSSYLGAISDRSKELYFQQQTIGQKMYDLLKIDPHTPLRNKVFYRQDYLNEFETIWEIQSAYHDVLKSSLKKEIRDTIIFYQRKLKSQKGLIAKCPFESYEHSFIEPVTKKSIKRLIGPRVAPKSSPIFQRFKIWQEVNDLVLKHIDSGDPYQMSQEERGVLFNELNLRGNLSQSAILALLRLKSKEWKSNFPKGLEGNHTNKALFDAYQTIAEEAGYGFDWNSKRVDKIIEELEEIFPHLGIDQNVLYFDPTAILDQQKSYQLWHLIYATEDDDQLNPLDREIYGDHMVTLKKRLCKKFGFTPRQSQILASISFKDDYASLSAKAIRKILPYLENGLKYSDACVEAGYNHSNSLTKEQRIQRVLKEQLELLPRNSLRQPIVEKILNQMVHVVNQLMTRYGKPDEVRIELARELKASQEKRKQISEQINKGTKYNDEIRKIIKTEFGLANPTKNDVIKYKLYDELKVLGYKSLYTGVKIPHENLFSKNIDIEHIIPRAIHFDDSYQNKTLAFRDVNLAKADRTAIDFMESDYASDVESYKSRLSILLKSNPKLERKIKNLLKPLSDVGSEFSNRDLTQTQYIAKKAKEMLEEVVPDVLPSIGRITDRLRREWGLIDVMRELNLPKYRAAGLTEIQERKHGRHVEVIVDWTKRNDHRHHAMDALAVAFTTRSHIQFLNNLKDAYAPLQSSKLYGLREKLTEKVEQRNSRTKRKFRSPMPSFRHEAKRHLEAVLISYKAKNKVVTRNVNKIKIKKRFIKKIQLTPRRQLHNDTYYGKIKRPSSKTTKINAKLTLNKIHQIVHPGHQSRLMNHAEKYSLDFKKAFSATSLKKDPIIYKGDPLKEVTLFEEVFTTRKSVDKDLNVAKVIDPRVRDILLQRLELHGNDKKKAFSDLEKNPIWLNKNAGISIKRVIIEGPKNVEALHNKLDHHGQVIVDKAGSPIQKDFVQTSGNHHVAIYRDAENRLQESVVSYFEATALALADLPIVDKTLNIDLGWTFMFTFKKNEMFIFSGDDDAFKDIDLMDTQHSALISPRLFRVQSLAWSKYGNSVVRSYDFRHHLETQSNEIKALNGSQYFFIKSLDDRRLNDCTKVRLNHLGEIVAVGES